jgi:hypothetical protein
VTFNDVELGFLLADRTMDAVLPAREFWHYPSLAPIAPLTRVDKL